MTSNEFVARAVNMTWLQLLEKALKAGNDTAVRREIQSLVLKTKQELELPL